LETAVATDIDEVNVAKADKERRRSKKRENGALWSPHALAYFASVKKEIDESLNYTGRSRTGRFAGTFPHKYRGLVAPSKDTIGYFSDADRVLTMSDFCLPNLFVWCPEAEYPMFYPNAVPPCKFHGCTDCVKRNGWLDSPVRGHSGTRNVAIMCKQYYCSERKKSGIKPHYFKGIDKQVIEYSNDYIKMKWRTDGYDFTHTSGLSLTLLRELITASGQGVSISGFRQNLIQQLKEYHLTVAIQWRTYVMHLRNNPPEGLTQADLDSIPQEFVEFNSKEYDQTIPSSAWLIERLRLLEQKADAVEEEKEDIGSNTTSAFNAIREGRKKRQRRTHLSRCRRCGKCYGLEEWKDLHGHWDYRKGMENRVWELCTVDESDFEPGFPHLDLDKKMPRKSRAKKQIA
jgi:hypothetical protein